MRLGIVLLLLLAAPVVAGCSEDGTNPSAAARKAAARTPKASCPAGWQARWQRLANRVDAPVYCPTWMPSPLDGKIGGDWNDGVSVDPDRSWLVSFLWHEPPSQDVHVNFRGYPGRTAIPKCDDDNAPPATTRLIACFRDPGPARRVAGFRITPYTVNEGVDQWHVLYAWRVRGTLYTVSEHVAKPLTYRRVVQNLDRLVAGLDRIDPQG